MTEKFFTRKYHRENYNCAHFVADVWQEITGYDIRHVLSGVLFRPSEWHVKPSMMRNLNRLENPESPCIVIMQGNKIESHVGVFWRGRILHMDKWGVHYQIPALATYGFNKVGYYTCK